MKLITTDYQVNGDKATATLEMIGFFYGEKAEIEEKLDRYSIKNKFPLMIYN